MRVGTLRSDRRPRSGADAREHRCASRRRTPTDVGMRRAAAWIEPHCLRNAHRGISVAPCEATRVQVFQLTVFDGFVPGAKQTHNAPNTGLPSTQRVSARSTIMAFLPSLAGEVVRRVARVKLCPAEIVIPFVSPQDGDTSPTALQRSWGGTPDNRGDPESFRSSPGRSPFLLPSSRVVGSVLSCFSSWRASTPWPWRFCRIS